MPACIFIEHTIMFVVYLHAAKGFTSNVSIVVVGHWSKDKSLQFNFTSDAEHSNAITYFMAKQSTHCAHPIQRSSIWELLKQLVSRLSFPGQTVVEFFPRFSCGE